MKGYWAATYWGPRYWAPTYWPGDDDELEPGTLVATGPPGRRPIDRAFIRVPTKRARGT